MNNKIILGTANFDFNYKLKGNSKISNKQIDEILKTCLNNNIKYLDTASNYKNSEKKIGEKIKKNKNFFKIITKFSYENNYNIEQEYLNSKRRLKENPWSILLHKADDYIYNNKYRDNLFLLKKNKKIKKVGVSVYTEDEINKILKIKKPDIIQLPINILDQKLLKNGLLKKIKNKKIEIHARSIFLRGLLFYKSKQLQTFFPELSEEFNYLNKIAIDLNLNIAQLSLLWVSKIVEIDKIIIGVTSSYELKQNLNVLKKNLNKNYFEKIKKININNDNITNPSKWKKKF